FYFQAEDVIRDELVTGVQTCALPISAEVRCGDRREQRLVDRAAAAFLHRGGEALGGVVADRDVGHHQVPALDAALPGELAKAVEIGRASWGRGVEVRGGRGCEGRGVG